MRRVTIVCGETTFAVWYRYRPDRPATLDDPGQEEAVEIEEVRAMVDHEPLASVLSTTFAESLRTDASLRADVEATCLADWHYITKRSEDSLETLVLAREGA